jgi:hypothetical protein
MERYICKEGDIVIHKGLSFCVHKVRLSGRNPAVIKQGRKVRGVKSDIVVCRIMDNGQVLKNTTKVIGGDWE